VAKKGYFVDTGCIFRYAGCVGFYLEVEKVWVESGKKWEKVV